LFSHFDRKAKLNILEVGTQKGLTQLLDDKDIRAIGVKVGGNDKRTRLSMVSEYVRSGKIEFPEKGADELIDQILDFGVAANDDLVDAFTTLIAGIVQSPPSTFNMSPEEMQQLRKDMYSAFYSRGSIYGGEDWAEREDREIFGRLNRHPWGPGRGSSIEFGSDGLPHRRY